MIMLWITYFCKYTCFVNVSVFFVFVESTGFYTSFIVGMFLLR